MNNTNNIVVKDVPSATLQYATVTIRSGQIWRDGHPRSNNRLMLVLDPSGEKVVCQSLVTGKFSSIRREQFNRGRTGFIYASNLKDICGKYTNYIINGLYQQPAANSKEQHASTDVSTNTQFDPVRLINDAVERTMAANKNDNERIGSFARFYASRTRTQMGH